MTRIFPLSGGTLCISGSTSLGGSMTPFCLLSRSLRDPGGASGTGLDGVGFGLIFSGGVCVGSPGVGLGRGAWAVAVSARSGYNNAQAIAPTTALPVLKRKRRIDWALHLIMNRQRPRADAVPLSIASVEETPEELRFATSPRSSGVASAGIHSRRASAANCRYWSRI